MPWGAKLPLQRRGRIEEATLGNDGFIGKENELQKKGREVSRVVWPDEYRRYSVGEIIARAKKCKEENLYDLMKNNCESFIMWCFCDLNISLQATPARETLYEMVWVVYAQLRQLVQQLPKLMSADYGDDVLIGALKAIDWEPFTAGQLAELGFYVGVSLPVLIEIGVAIHGIKQACKKWDNGKRKSVSIQREVFRGSCSDSGVGALSLRRKYHRNIFRWFPRSFTWDRCGTSSWKSLHRANHGHSRSVTTVTRHCKK
ncbi:hypothetical protein OS493_035359 [Desmophyllum pertusum]|uniref:LRAT domain-containing protein n=1 Tax=Desmophyllum pertusum TaxID=174260 RepID=A0A9W9Y949_9CNID|nr:hypothetical protein OS493_035359 [Desmophyllum pertusum]